MANKISDIEAEKFWNLYDEDTKEIFLGSTSFSKKYSDAEWDTLTPAIKDEWKEWLEKTPKTDREPEIEKESSTPELNTIEQKREFFVGKHLADKEGKLEEIKQLKYSKIKQSYTIETDNKEGGFAFDEEQIGILSNGGETPYGYFIDELQEKQPEENISISKEALKFISDKQEQPESSILDDLEQTDKEGVEKLVAQYPELKLTEIKEGDFLVEVIEIIPVEVEVLKNSPDFKYYALTEDDKIVKGGEYKEDVREFISDRKALVKLRLVSKRDLKPDPNDNSNWVEDSSEKIDLRRRILGWWEAETKEFADQDTVAAIAGNSEYNEDVIDIKKITDELYNNNKRTLDNGEFLKVVTAYGDEILRKAVCAKNYLMTITEKKLRDEYKKLEMFY